MEGEHHGQGGGVRNLSNGGAGRNQVAPLDQHLLNHPGPARPNGEVGGQVVVALLGLTDGQLGLLDAHFRILGVQTVEELSLFHPVPHFKGGLQNLTGDQRL